MDPVFEPPPTGSLIQVLKENDYEPNTDVPIETGAPQSGVLP